MLEEKQRESPSVLRPVKAAAHLGSNPSLPLKAHSKKKLNSGRILLRRFKICAFAVYFSIFLPSLSRRLYRLRLKEFMKEYPHQVAKYFTGKGETPTMSKLKFDEGKIWGVFSEKLNILKMVEEEGLDSCFKDGGSVK